MGDYLGITWNVLGTLSASKTGKSFSGSTCRVDTGRSVAFGEGTSLECEGFEAMAYAVGLCLYNLNLGVGLCCDGFNNCELAVQLDMARNHTNNKRDVDTKLYHSLKVLHDIHGKPIYKPARSPLIHHQRTPTRPAW